LAAAALFCVRAWASVRPTMPATPPRFFAAAGFFLAALLFFNSLPALAMPTMFDPNAMSFSR